MMDSYYKVLRKVMSSKPPLVQELHSAFSPNPVIYTPGETTYPLPGTGLFVFNSLTEARNYGEGLSESYEIWECEVTNPRAGWLSSKVDSVSQLTSLFAQGGLLTAADFGESPYNKCFVEMARASYVVDSVTLTAQVFSQFKGRYFM